MNTFHNIPVPAHESEILKRIEEEIHTHLPVNSPFDDWKEKEYDRGVVIEDGHVAALGLSYKLHNSVPAKIIKMSTLRGLDLRGNNLKQLSENIGYLREFIPVLL